MTGDVPPARQCTMPTCKREATDPGAPGSLCEHHLTALDSDSPVETVGGDAEEPPHDNPIDARDVTDADRAAMLREYLEAFVEEFDTVPRLMPLDEEGKAPIIQGRCRLDSPEGRALLVDGEDAIEQIRNGARGFALYAGKRDHGTEDALFVDHDDPEAFPSPTGAPTLEVLSGSGRGPHETYRNEGDVENARVGENVGEIRAENWYVVVPGSIHPSGGVYHVTEHRDIATLSDDDLDDSMRPATRRREEQARTAPEPEDLDGEGDLPDETETQERLEAAFNNPHDGDRIEKVYNGRYRAAGFDDRSGAEFWLANRLDSWVGLGSERRVERLMDRANLQKWPERTDRSYRSSVLANVGYQDWYYDPDEEGGDDVEPTAALGLARLQALDECGRKRALAQLDVPTNDEVADRIQDAVESAFRDEGYAVLQAPTGGNKTGVAAETTWRDVDEAITGDRPVVLFSETTDARDEAVERAREAGLKFLVLRGAAELCSLVAGDFDPANIDEDDPDAPAPILFDGEPAGEWFARQTTQKGVPISVAHRDAEERLRRRGRECPCCSGEQECRTKTQWPDDGLTDDDGHPRYDLVIATDPFAYVPSLRANTNVLHDEQPTYEEDFGLDAPTPEAVTARVRRAVTAFLRESDTGPDTFEALVELARACARCDATPWNEHAAPGEKPDEELGRRWIQTFSALEYEPERRWYLRNLDAHTLAPALARAIWKAIAGDVDRVTDPDDRGGGIFDTNGRAKATVSHSPPRLDEDARADDGWNRTHVTVTFDDENTIRGVRNAPDFSTARSVVGLDARPTAWLWQRNVHPDMTTERVLDVDEARLWRRYERGQTVVQVGDATRPAGKEGRYFNARHARALVERLREHFGVDWGVGTAKAVASAAAGDEVDVGFRELLLDVGIPEDVVDDFIMTYGEEKSRNDFADLLAGLVYGCIDPGDDYVLDLLAECGLDARPERSEPCEDCDGDGCYECDGNGRKRAHGREFVGPDADHAAELLESVRATHVAQMVGRYGRNVDVENGDRCLTFVATDAVPDDLVDYQVPGVEWLATDLHRDILDELAARPNATTLELADAVGCTKEHVRQTLVRFKERGTVRRRSRAGRHGADEWTLSEGGTTRPDDVQLRLDEIANPPVQSSCTWELAIRNRHAVSDVDEARDGHGEGVAVDGGVSIGGDPPPDDPA